MFYQHSTSQYAGFCGASRAPYSTDVMCRDCPCHEDKSGLYVHCESYESRKDRTTFEVAQRPGQLLHVIYGPDWLLRCISDEMG